MTGTGSGGRGTLTAHKGGVAPAGAHAADVGAGVLRAQPLGAVHLAPAARAQRLPEAAETATEPGPGALLGHALGRRRAGTGDPCRWPLAGHCSRLTCKMGEVTPSQPWLKFYQI